MSAHWRKTLDLADVFHAETSFEQKRDTMVPRVRALDPRDDHLQRIADGLSVVADEDEWDNLWDEFYDWADRCRVWVVTR